MSDYLSRNLPTVADVAKTIDHTILHPFATREDVLKIAREGLEFQTASVCVQPIWVADVAEVLKGSNVLTCSVVGFPHGASRPQTIAFEADRAVREGAREIDMVMPIGKARMGDWEAVKTSVATVKAAIGDNVLKVIFEICDLTPDEIRRASEISAEAGADFIKTSTGFSKHGATVEAVKIMADIADGKVGVKAAGGIRTFDTLREMIGAGATRIGASATIKILEQAREILER